MKPRRILFFKNNDEDKKETKKEIKNDLLSIDKDSFKESKQTFLAIKKYGFSKKTLKLVKDINTDIRWTLNLTDLQYLLLAISMNTQTINLQTVANLINENALNAMTTILSNLFELYHRGIFIIIPGEGDITFRTSISFLDFAYRKVEIKKENKSLKKIIYEIDTIANLYNGIPPISLIGEQNIVKILTTYENDYEYCRFLRDIYIAYLENGANIPGGATPDYKFLFYMMGHLILNSRDCPSMDKNDQLIEMFIHTDPIHEAIVNHIYNNENHLFFKEKIFDHACDENGKADKNAIELHADFKRKYIKDMIRERKHDDLLKSAKITKKELFFNDSNKEQIEELGKMLTVKSFNNIKKRLSKAGARTGFICLFSGFAGCGKTELALQLAKKTGRDIIKVDMSTLRSKWWGEDEKNVKNIFNNYKAILQDSKIEPILLLNEADAIIGKRLDVTGNNGAIISSINATQNIILDAFEEFEGILIATTNLTTNMDNAFERRFLYKIEFEKPNVETRAKILSNMLKIPEDDAAIIAKDHELTGGNIENIYRKMMTRKVLYGEEYDIEKIITLCKDEKIQKNISIGFGR
jgi:hypothetical protein